MCFEEFTWSITFDLDILVYIYTQDVFSLHIGKEKFLVAINSSMSKIGMLLGRHTNDVLFCYMLLRSRFIIRVTCYNRLFVPKSNKGRFIVKVAGRGRFEFAE
jgi:hypothetical protein